MLIYYLRPFLYLAGAVISIDSLFLISGIVPTTPGSSSTCTRASLLSHPDPQAAPGPPPPAPGPSRSRRSPPRGAPPLLVPAGAAGKAALAAHPLALPPPPSPERRAASRLLRPFGSKLSWKRERGRQERGRDWGAGARIMRQEGVRHKASGTRRTCSSSRSRSALRQRH